MGYDLINKWTRFNTATSSSIILVGKTSFILVLVLKYLLNINQK